MKDLHECLLHEAAEMERRCAESLAIGDAAWWLAYEHKRRAFLQAACWVEAEMSGARPGQGGHAAASREFHEYGKPFPPLPVPESKGLATERIEVSAHFVAGGKIDAI